MRIVFVTHSLVSCWNHGNAHFLRGLMRALLALGHDPVAMEPADGWSRKNLLADHGETALAAFRTSFPDLAPRARTYRGPDEIDAGLEGADLVVVHEWTDPAVIARLGRLRARGARFRLLFHDTHHRAVSAPEEMAALDLDGYDGVLAFGESLAEVYRARGWGRRAFTFHEAADTTLFRPPEGEALERAGIVWVGNWGDDERSRELERLLFAPAAAIGLPLDVHGVRYPPEALAVMRRHGARYHGFLANADAPAAFAKHLATVHVPRRYYARLLPGIPTIRVFEALAAGIPLVSTVWRDVEGLFTPGFDYLVAGTADEVEAHLARIAADRDLGPALTANGLETIRKRHTCDHRAAELVGIAESLAGRRLRPLARESAA